MKQSPIKVGGGQVLNFTDDTLEVVTVRCLRKPIKRSILWDTITKIDTELTCFSGIIIISVNTGKTFEFQCKKKTIRLALAALYKHVGRDAGPSRSVDLRPEVAENLKAHRKVIVYNDGLVLRKRTGCCKASLKFVPWGALISVSLSPNKRSVIARTTIQNEEAVEEAAQLVSQDTETTFKEDGEAEEPEEEQMTQEQEEEELGIIRIPGTRALSEALFDEIVYMISDGHGEEELTEEPIGTWAASARLTTAGVLIERGAGYCCWAGVEKYFVPWRSLIALKWRPGGLFAKKKLSVMDVTGCEVNLQQATQEDFRDFRNAFQAGTNEVQVTGNSESSNARANVKGMELRQDGMMLTSRACCCALSTGFSFVPWSRVDGVEVRMGCCGIGGNALLVTEGGERLWVARSTFDTTRLWGVFDRVHTLKYGESGEKLATFNRNRDPRYSCELTSKSIRIVIGRCIREWDLERIISCRACSRREGSNRLKLCLLVGPGQREVFRLAIKDCSNQKDEKISVSKLSNLIIRATMEHRRQQRETDAKVVEANAEAWEEAREKKLNEEEAPAAPPPTASSSKVNFESVSEAGPMVVSTTTPQPDTFHSVRTSTETPSELPDHEEAFVVNLEDFSGESTNCGLLVFMRRNESHCALYVQAVLQGPVESWNERNPDKEVRHGDFITSVAGCKDDPMVMLSNLQKQGAMELIVQRKWP